MNQKYKEREEYFISLAIASGKVSISEMFSLPAKFPDIIVKTINEINEEKKKASQS